VPKLLALLIENTNIVVNKNYDVRVVFEVRKFSLNWTHKTESVAGNTKSMIIEKKLKLSKWVVVE
jgi:hypothetical protein